MNAAVIEQQSKGKSVSKKQKRQNKRMHHTTMAASAAGSTNNKINAAEFYSEYHGHPVPHLAMILPRLREASDRIIWTAGDSSLDNKYWFRNRDAAPRVYRDILQPPQCKKDVTYWLNYLCENAGAAAASGNNNNNLRQRTVAINTAVEATTVNERTFRLRPQDIFIRDNIQRQDVLVVSIGGNDVALAPCPCTIASICCLLGLPAVCTEKGFTCGTVPLDDCCCGCGPSLCSCLCACPPCLGYNRHLFGTRVQKYIEKLVSKTKPSKILVCMIYYPDEHITPGWAGPALGALGYNRNPEKLQMFIRKAYEDAVSRIHIPGSQVIPVPLFNVLDGKQTMDYVARVEPSPTGGRKMAEFILDAMDRDTFGATSQSFFPSLAAPSTTLIQGRG